MIKCPFCKNKKPISDNRQKEIIQPRNFKVLGKYYAVFCQECGASGPHGKTRKEAEKLWNARKQ